MSSDTDAAAGASSHGDSAVSVVPFNSSHGRAVFAIFLLAAGVVLSIVWLWAYFDTCALFNRVMARFPTAEIADFRIAEARLSVVTLLDQGLFVVTGIAFLMSTYRAHQNLPALGATGLRFSPRWGVAWFLIPIMNLFRPYQVVKEIWRASNPNYEPGDGWKTEPATAIFALWWMAWLASLVTIRVWEDPGKVSHFQINMLMPPRGQTAVQEALSMFAALFAIILVQQIDRRQQERFERLQSGSLELRSTLPAPSQA